MAITTPMAIGTANGKVVFSLEFGFCPAETVQSASNILFSLRYLSFRFTFTNFALTCFERKLKSVAGHLYGPGSCSHYGIQEDLVVITRNEICKGHRSVRIILQFVKILYFFAYRKSL